MHVNNTPLYLHCHYALSPEDRLKKYILVQKIYAKKTSSSQNINFYQIFNFKGHLMPFEAVDFDVIRLKSYIWYYGLIYIKIEFEAPFIFKTYRKIHHFICFANMHYLQKTD